MKNIVEPTMLKELTPKENRKLIYAMRRCMPTHLTRLDELFLGDQSPFTTNKRLRARNELTRELYNLVRRLPMEDLEIERMWVRQWREAGDERKLYNTVPPIEKKDNKDHYATGNRRGNKNKIRYPRKARSKKTWEKFYSLFPWAKDLDNVYNKKLK
jgi:hypothetical protein